MEWPVGLVEKMGYADTIYSTLARFRKDGVQNPDERSIEYHIVKTWLNHIKQQARKRKNG